MLFGWFIVILGLLSDENTIFYFSLYDLCPLFFLGKLPGHKKDLGVFFKAILWFGSEQQTGARKIITNCNIRYFNLACI